MESGINNVQGVNYTCYEMKYLHLLVFTKQYHSSQSLCFVFVEILNAFRICLFTVSTGYSLLVQHVVITF